MQNITYKQKLTGRNVIKLLKSVFVPIIVFVTAILTINIYGEGFGKGIVGLFVSLMWGISIVMAIIFPSQREAIIKEVLVIVFVYSVGLLGIREIILKISGVTSQTLMASFGQQLPQSSGNAALGWLQTFLWIFSVMTPLGFIGYQGKRLINFRRMTKKEKFMDQKRSILQKGQHY